MTARLCVCGRDLPFGSFEIGPVSQIRSLKFYDNTAMIGYPASRQKVFLCEVCTPRLITLLEDMQRNGPGPREVSE